MMIEAFDELKDLIVCSGLSVHRIATESTVCHATIDSWLDGRTRLPRLDTMLKVARVVGRNVELTANMRKTLGYYPPPKRKPRLALWRLQ
jgi:hypothetical protein